MKNYWRTSRTATYGFLGALPLLLLYEISVLIVNRGAPAEVRVGADVWIKQAMSWLGATGMFAVGIGVIAIGISVFVAERKHEIPLRPDYFAGIVGESLVYAVFTALLVSGLVGSIFGLWPGAVGSFEPGMGLATDPGSLAAGAGGSLQEATLNRPTMLALSIGAGLYEELVFRVLLVGGLFLAMKKLLPRQSHAYLVAAIVGALIFSAVHYMGPFADTFTASSFSFRFLFGLVLNGIFLIRGFAVAAWTHSIYDVLVVTQLLG